jgi:hypothetical protein
MLLAAKQKWPVPHFSLPEADGLAPEAHFLSPEADSWLPVVKILPTEAHF